MRLSTTVIVILMLACGHLFGQPVDPSVQGVDPSVNVSVQDPDHPDSALLPGGSVAWTGQPVMSHTPSTPAQKNSGGRGYQFPSLVGMSSWGPSQGVASSASNADAVRGRTAQPTTKYVLSRKLDEMREASICTRRNGAAAKISLH